jgi:organic radical activating enzyme
MIYIAEHFYSIQGEGKYSGVPSIFLRFGGCNLRCEGFNVSYKIEEKSRIGCDSFYAVDRDFSNSWQKIEKLIDIKNILSRYPQFVKDIVLTGGEPLVYAKNPLFIEILKFLKESGFRVTVETNGTIFLDDFEEFKGITYSIALKLANSEEEFNKRFILDAINSILDKSEDIFFKFTIDKTSIKKGIAFEIKKIARFFPETKIYCMPVGKNREELNENSEAVLELCLKEGYFYSDRLQVRIWNDKKGC